MTSSLVDGSTPGGTTPDHQNDHQEQRAAARLLQLRPARTRDVVGISRLVDVYSGRRILLAKERVTLYEAIQEFKVVVDADESVIACGALHVLWEDLAEIRTIAADPQFRGSGLGHRIVEALIEQARALGVRRLFCLTFEVDFFAAHGFVEIEGTPVEPAVYAEMLRSMDEGVAEFLDLAHVKPNTLGNHRMILNL